MRGLLISLFLLLLVGCGGNQGWITNRSPGETNRTVTEDVNRYKERINRVVYAPAVPPAPISSPTGRNGLNAPNQTGSLSTYGLVRLTRRELDQVRQSTVGYDRNHLAQLVAQAVSSLSGVRDVTILVTDDHAYVGYSTAEPSGQVESLDQQVKKSAQSVLPSYYDVFTSTNPSLTNEVIRLTNGKTERIDEDLDRLLMRRGIRKSGGR
ncbi:hypothetical protein CULT_690039 [[Clostridium] ultunense Esp]|nr:hypothetical protein CULT_690039 [[Clostridium] ultunense Esp]